MPRKDPEARRAYQHAQYLKNRAEIRRKQDEYNKTHSEEIKRQKHQHYINNRDDILLQNKIYRLNNLTQYRKQKKEYYQLHREEKITKQKKYAYEHQEEIREYKKLHRQKNKVKLSQQHKEIYEKNRLQRIEKQKKYYAENKEKILPITIAYRKSHPEMLKTTQRRRRAAKANSPINNLSHDQWLEIQAAQDYCCAYCDKRCKGHLTQDHITPTIRGGPHTLHNVVAACVSCNTKKHIGPPLCPVQPLLLTIAPAKPYKKRR